MPALMVLHTSTALHFVASSTKVPLLVSPATAAGGEVRHGPGRALIFRINVTGNNPSRLASAIVISIVAKTLVVGSIVARTPTMQHLEQSDG